MIIHLNRNKVRGIGTQLIHKEKKKKIYITKYCFILLRRTDNSYIFKINIKSFLRVLTLELDIVS